MSDSKSVNKMTNTVLSLTDWMKLSTLRESIVCLKPLILIDGVAGSGKTTLATKLADIFNANIVNSDDLCWGADPIHWDAEMLTGIVNPWINGNDIAYKPTGWIKENRPGSIDVDSNKALVIEGMGASRKTLRSIATYSIWVDAESEIAWERVVHQDLGNGELAQ